MPRKAKTDIWLRIQEAARDARHKATQGAIAELCSIKQPSVHEWASGDSMPSREAVWTIANKFNVCVEWIWTGRGPKRPPLTTAAYTDPVSNTLRDLWGQLNSTSRQEVLKAAMHWHALQDALTPERFKAMSESTGSFPPLPPPPPKLIPAKKGN